MFVIFFIIVLNVSNVFLHLLTCFAFIKFDQVSLVFSLFFFLCINFTMLCLDYQILLQLVLMEKWNEWTTMLVEDIDHTIHNVAFDCLVLSVYVNSSFSRSLAKSIVYSYLHANVIDFVGTTTIIISIKGTLIKTHSKLIKKGNFFRLEFFYIKAKSNYDKRYSNWTIELFITIKVTIVPPFDPLVKLFFHPKDTINNFGQCML
jgi:hypothetical protein